MLREMRPSELSLWAAIWAIDPWDEQRADLRAGITASVIANVNRDPKRRRAPFNAVDFMPYRQQDEEDRGRELSSRLRAGLMIAGHRKKRSTH